MSLKDVAAFINQGDTYFRWRDLDIGTEGPELPAFFAEARGSKIAIAYKSSDLPHSTNVSHVFESIPTPDGGWVLRIDNPTAPFATRSLHFRKATDSERSNWATLFAPVESFDDDVRAELRSALSGTSDFARADESQLRPFQYSSVISDEGQAIGVLVERSGQNVLALTFNEEREITLGRFANMASLSDAPGMAGRSLMIGTVRAIRGADAQDAGQRALYSLAKLHYQRTGKSVYA